MAVSLLPRRGSRDTAVPVRSAEATRSDVTAPLPPHAKLSQGALAPIHGQPARVLYRIAQLIRENAAELAELETLTRGKPIVESEMDIVIPPRPLNTSRAGRLKFGDVNPVPDNALSFTLKEPIGVCGPSSPELSVDDGGLEAGPSLPWVAPGAETCEQTPLSVLRLAELLHTIEELSKVL